MEQLLFQRTNVHTKLIILLLFGIKQLAHFIKLSFEFSQL